MEDKKVIFNDKLYIRNAKSNYYFAYETKPSKRKNNPQLHRAVWEFYNGEIPKGYQIHHKDKDIDNNDISNLEMINRSEHLSKHSKEMWKDPIFREKNLKTLDKIRDLTKEWHKSPEGKKWHSLNSKKMIENGKNGFLVHEQRICEFCGNDYISNVIGQKYCCAKCERKANNYKKTKICKNCGKEFHTTSEKSDSCSRECQNSLRKLKCNK